jgi:hypothetical protein
MEARLEPMLEDEATLPLSSTGPFVPLNQLMPGQRLDSPCPLEVFIVAVVLVQHLLPGE